jgi:hypothetical protein
MVLIYFVPIPLARSLPLLEPIPPPFVWTYPGWGPPIASLLVALIVVFAARTWLLRRVRRAFAHACLMCRYARSADAEPTALCPECGLPDPTLDNAALLAHNEAGCPCAPPDTAWLMIRDYHPPIFLRTPWWALVYTLLVIASWFLYEAFLSMCGSDLMHKLFGPHASPWASAVHGRFDFAAVSIMAALLVYLAWMDRRRQMNQARRASTDRSVPPHCTERTGCNPR